MFDRSSLSTMSASPIIKQGLVQQVQLPIGSEYNVPNPPLIDGQPNTSQAIDVTGYCGASLFIEQQGFQADPAFDQLQILLRWANDLSTFWNDTRLNGVDIEDDELKLPIAQAGDPLRWVINLTIPSGVKYGFCAAKNLTPVCSAPATLSIAWNLTTCC